MAPASIRKEPISSSSPESLAQDISQLVASRDTYCFVGAGISMACDQMKDWQGILQSLRNCLEKEPSFPGREATIQAFDAAMTDYCRLIRELAQNKPN